LWGGFTCIDVECTQFIFCCRGHNSLDELCKVENSPVVNRVFRVGKEEKIMSTCLAVYFGFAEVSGVTVYD
jgi:hypothetical protein